MIVVVLSSTSWWRYFKFSNMDSELDPQTKVSSVYLYFVVVAEYRDMMLDFDKA